MAAAGSNGGRSRQSPADSRRRARLMPRRNGRVCSSSPSSGKVLIEFDWVAQEAGIFAVYSQDPAMLAAYEDEDFPLAVARMCGGITPDADPGEIKVIRDRYKVVFYANTYGGGAKKLAEGLKITPAEAALIQRRINTTFRVGRGWLMRTRDRAFQRGKIETHLGSWSMNIPAGTKVTSIQNWKIQAGGAELLRETLSLIDAAGIKICARSMTPSSSRPTPSIPKP